MLFVTAEKFSRIFSFEFCIIFECEPALNFDFSWIMSISSNTLNEATVFKRKPLRTTHNARLWTQGQHARQAFSASIVFSCPAIRPDFPISSQNRNTRLELLGSVGCSYESSLDSVAAALLRLHFILLLIQDWIPALSIGLYSPGELPVFRQGELNSSVSERRGCSYFKLEADRLNLRAWFQQIWGNLRAALLQQNLMLIQTAEWTGGARGPGADLCPYDTFFSSHRFILFPTDFDFFPISATSALTKPLTYPSTLGRHTLHAAAHLMTYPKLSNVMWAHNHPLLGNSKRVWGKRAFCQVL